MMVVNHGKVEGLTEIAQGQEMVEEWCEIYVPSQPATPEPVGRDDGEK